MNRIKMLPESVKKKIAAGEVVEGPFSVLKELLENAIDAGSTEIDVEVFDSGLKKISVRDNGEGMHRGDLHLAVMEHATSKIREAQDIESIASYGFRGEALASISSISNVTILSRCAEEEIGGRLSCRDDRVDVSDYAGARGSMVLVENLFYNTPARKKFLKSRAAELRNIKNVFLHIALANPDISFSFSSDDRRVITLPAAGGIGSRIDHIFGKGTLEKLYFERIKDIKVEIGGFLSKPDFLKSSRSLQLLYVNKRLVEYRYLGYLLTRAYEAVAPRGRHPAAILFITVEPELVDVNIHPAKREVKFFDQRYVDALISGLCGKVLAHRIHSVPERNILPASIPEGVHPAPDPGFSQPVPGEQTSMPDFSLKAIIRDSALAYKESMPRTGVRVIGLAFESYILFEFGGALHFADFHAAHERFLYDELMSKGDAVETQALIFPRTVELSIEEYDLIKERWEDLKEIGFDIDDFSDRTVVIRGVPEPGGAVDIDEFFADLLDAMKNEGAGSSGLKSIIAQKIACHSAKRAGDALTPDDAEALILEALSGRHELRCPHGRPYMFKMEKKDIERMFKRA